MASELTHLVAQQLIDCRPSPTLELNRTLETGTPSLEQPSAFLSPAPSKTAPGQQAPPSTPTTTASTPAKRPALTRADDSTPVSKRIIRNADDADDSGNTSSPKGAKDIFSMSTDRQLSDMYKFVEEIGFGNWGSVWKVQQKQSPNKIEAVKLVFRVKEDKTTPARVRSIWQEFKVIRSFKGEPHPNIICFYDFIITPSYALVTMDIHNKLMPTNVAESVARSYFSGLLSGIDYLHTHGVTHNDIKPANILLSSEDQPIIVDFGFANRWSLGSDHSGSAFQTNLSWGTPEYLSPERAAQKLHDERLADVWSLGITMYEIVVGRTPFEKDNTEEFTSKDALEVYYNRTLTGQFHGHYRISLAFEDLIRQMVEPSIARRLPSCAKGLLHPFFSLRPPSVMGTIVQSTTNPSPFAVPSVPLPPKPVAAEPVSALSPVKPAAVASNHKTSSSKKDVFVKPKPPTASTTRIPAPSSVSAQGNKVASTPKKKNKGLKVFQDSPAKTTAENVPSAQAKQTGLRPLLLRAETAQSVRTSSSESPDLQPEGPLTSTPKKVLGNNTGGANGLSNRASIRSGAGTPSKKNQAANGIMLGASIRDSKELRSPDSIKVFRSTVDNKENVGLSPMQGKSPMKAKSPQQDVKTLGTRQAHNKEASPPPFTTNIVPLQPTVPTQSMIQPVERPYKLSKRRPSMKSQKSTSALSFHSISSTFRLSKGKALEEKHVSAQEVDDDYAFVERDGRVSSDEGPRPSGTFGAGYGEYSNVLHIRKADGDKQEIIQERIISPQAQREHGEAVARQFERSSMSRSNSVSSSYKRLPEVPIPPVPSPPPVPREPIASPTIRVRRSMAPSFASRPSTKAESERCDSRQSDFSEGSVEPQDEQNDDAESLRSEQAAGRADDATATYVPAIQVSRPYSVSSAARVRSCWSPETCQSETIESEDEGDVQNGRDSEGDDTIHAAPAQVRRTSGVFQRAPRAESIYQSFICASPTIEVPVKSYSPSPRSTSLNATWSPSSRSMATPTPEMLREYSDLSKINANVSQYTLFPPPDDLRSLASPPPRPETSNSRRTIGKMKSFFGRFGFGSSGR